MRAVSNAAVSSLRSLCEWMVAARNAPLPPSIRRRAALVLFDDIAAMFAAGDDPLVRATCRSWIAAPLESPSGEATIFTKGLPRARRDDAALANGLAVVWGELDEGFRGTPCHAGAYILPALLGDAEARGAPVEATLTALAIAYEATARVALAFPQQTPRIHPHGAYNAIGAAIGVALSRGYDAPGLFRTITTAASLVNPGPFNHAFEGALARNLWAAIGAVSGLRAAQAAEAGIGGLPSALIDVYSGAFGRDVDAAQLAPIPEGRWAIEGNFHKLYACCQYAHSAAEAALELRARLGDPLIDRRIARIEVEVHPLALPLDTVDPATVLAAKFSLPHVLAAATIFGSVGAMAFKHATLTDERIARLRRRVAISPHRNVGAWPEDRPAKVRWVLDDGEAHESEVRSARGGIDRPFADSEILAKIETLTGPSMPGLGAICARAIDGEAIDLTVGQMIDRAAQR